MKVSWQTSLVYFTHFSAAFSVSSPRPRSSYVALTHQDQTCGLPSASLINSTGTNTTLNPFILPQGPLNTTARNWTWTLATTTTGPNHESIDTVQQKLYLSVHPEIDLTSSNLTPVKPGCGVVFHGLNHAAMVRGQDDSGNCKSMLSSRCIRALQSQTDRFLGRCEWNTTGFTMPGECTDYFDPTTVIQTFTFASSSNKTDMCSSSSSSSSSSTSSSNPTSTSSTPPSSTIITSWALTPFIHNSTFLSPQSLSRTPYDNLTTLISPIMVHLGEGNSGRLFCIRTNQIRNGSFVPSVVPGFSGGPWWAVPVEMLVFCLLVGLALM